MTTPAADRTLDAMRRLVLSFMPSLVYWIVHEYAVQDSAIDAAGVASFSALATDAAFSPQLPVRVPYSPALAGSSCLVPPGTLVYVGFANADGGKPYVLRFGAPSASTRTAIDAAAILLAGGGPAVVRVGDDGGELCADSLGVVHYKAATGTGAWSPLPVYPFPGPPPGAFPGAAIKTTTGSGKVTCG